MIILAARYNLDLVELYCYKLLESTGVGPSILFIPNVVASKSIIYIGSKLLPDFCPFGNLDLRKG